MGIREFAEGRGVLLRREMGRRFAGGFLNLRGARREMMIFLATSSLRPCLETTKTQARMSRSDLERRRRA